MRVRQFPRRHGQPAGLGGGSLRRPACDVRHADLHFQRRNQFLRRMPRCGPLRRDLEGFLLRKPRGLPPRSGRELGHPLGSRGDRQEGPGQFRVRLLPGLPRGGLPDPPRRREQNLLLLPQPGPAPERAVALLRRIDAYEHGPVERPRVRRLPPEQYPGDARMLQQHAVPRRHRSRHGGSPRAFPGATHTSADPTSFTADCSACHAVTGVSPDSAAPLCTVCHQSATALPFTNCTSCHARPPTGTDYPDVAGSHAGHDALANVTGVCASCHNGLGTGTTGHYDRANARPGKDALRVPPGEAASSSGLQRQAGPAAFDTRPAPAPT